MPATDFFHVDCAGRVKSQVSTTGRILEPHTRPEDLDAWDLTLTCGHTVRRTQHRDHGDRRSWRVAECATGEQRRGVIAAERIGPAGDPFLTCCPAANIRPSSKHGSSTDGKS